MYWIGQINLRPTVKSDSLTRKVCHYGRKKIVSYFTEVVWHRVKCVRSTILFFIHAEQLYCVCPLQLPTFSFHKMPSFTFYFWKWITPSLQSAHYYLRIFFDRILIGADNINSSVIAYPTRQFRTRNLRKPCKPVACIRKTRKGKKYFFK